MHQSLPTKTINCWGDLDGISCVSTIDQCYNEAIHWKHVYFQLPSGHTGNNFVPELIRLLRCFAEASALACVTLKAVFLSSCPHSTETISETCQG